MVLKAADISVRFAGVSAVDHVSLALGQGDILGLIGPNGAGKTTMMRAILGLLPLGSGRLDVLGVRPRRGNPAIGYVPQSRRAASQLGITGAELLLSASRGEHWGLPLPSVEDRRSVAAALERVDASDLAQRAISELSGGERQRLFIAQALVGTPRLLLLDEPLISLDPAHQRTIVDLVRDISREHDIAVLFSAHEINPLLRAVDKVLYLGNGHAAIGTVDEVINEPVLSALYRTDVRVIRTGGRIFVLAEDGALDGHDHHHHDDHHVDEEA